MEAAAVLGRAAAPRPKRWPPLGPSASCRRTTCGTSWATTCSSATKSVGHLEVSGLVDRIRLDAHRHDREAQPRQTFYAGLKKPRELTHDAHVYRSFQRAETRLRGQGARVRRVVLDYELKRDYQQFLQERNRGRGDSDGREVGAR